MTKITFSVDGMMCPMCEAHVNESVRNAFKVKSVAASHKEHSVTVVLEDASLSDAIAEVIAKQGYKVNSSTSEPYEKPGLFAKFKKNK